MKSILIVGAGACGIAVARALESAHLRPEDVIIVTPENIDQLKEEIKENSPFAPEPIPITAPPRIDFEYTPTIEEINRHPFAKFMGKKKRW